MNVGAIELYQSHGIDLYSEMLEIAVCAQHCNGGVAVDGDWQSDIKGLYVAGEAAGTFGVYRPGGSALNSTQVGAIRVAEYIASSGRKAASVPEYSLPNIKYGESNIKEMLDSLQTEMSRVADFDRRTDGMKALYKKVSDIYASFFDIATIADASEVAELFKLYDTVITERAALSAMIKSAEEIGTHGAAFVDRQPDKNAGSARKTRTLTRGADSYLEDVSPMPDPELWFETLLARQRSKNK